MLRNCHARHICRQAEKQDELFQESNAEGTKVGDCLHRAPSQGLLCSSRAAQLRACIWSLGPVTFLRSVCQHEAGTSAQKEARLAPRAGLQFGSTIYPAPTTTCKKILCLHFYPQASRTRNSSFLFQFN